MAVGGNKDNACGRKGETTGFDEEHDDIDLIENLADGSIHVHGERIAMIKVWKPGVSTENIIDVVSG